MKFKTLLNLASFFASVIAMLICFHFEASAKTTILIIWNAAFAMWSLHCFYDCMSREIDREVIERRLMELEINRENRTKGTKA